MTFKITLRQIFRSQTRLDGLNAPIVRNLSKFQNFRFSVPFIVSESEKPFRGNGLMLATTRGSVEDQVEISLLKSVFFFYYIARKVTTSLGNQRPRLTTRVAQLGLECGLCFYKRRFERLSYWSYSLSACRCCSCWSAVSTLASTWSTLAFIGDATVCPLANSSVPMKLSAGRKSTGGEEDNAGVMDDAFLRLPFVHRVFDSISSQMETHLRDKEKRIVVTSDRRAPARYRTLFGHVRESEPLS